MAIENRWGAGEQLQDLYVRDAQGVRYHPELTADHVITRSFYVLDPDGNRLEFYAQLMPAAEAKRYLHQ